MTYVFPNFKNVLSQYHREIVLRSRGCSASTRAYPGVWSCHTADNSTSFKIPGLFFRIIAHELTIKYTESKTLKKNYNSHHQEHLT